MHSLQMGFLAGRRVVPGKQVSKATQVFGKSASQASFAPLSHAVKPVRRDAVLIKALPKSNHADPRRARPCSRSRSPPYKYRVQKHQKKTPGIGAAAAFALDQIPWGMPNAGRVLSIGQGYDNNDEESEEMDTDDEDQAADTQPMDCEDDSVGLQQVIHKQLAWQANFKEHELFALEYRLPALGARLDLAGLPQPGEEAICKELADWVLGRVEVDLNAGLLTTEEEQTLCEEFEDLSLSSWDMVDSIMSDTAPFACSYTPPGTPPAAPSQARAPSPSSPYPAVSSSPPRTPPPRILPPTPSFPPRAPPAPLRQRAATKPSTPKPGLQRSPPKMLLPKDSAPAPASNDDEDDDEFGGPPEVEPPPEWQ